MQTTKITPQGRLHSIFRPSLRTSLHSHLQFTVFLKYFDSPMRIMNSVPEKKVSCKLESRSMRKSILFPKECCILLCAEDYPKTTFWVCERGSNTTTISTFIRTHAWHDATFCLETISIRGYEQFCVQMKFPKNPRSAIDMILFFFVIHDGSWCFFQKTG